jgi:hypothetical protein
MEFFHHRGHRAHREMNEKNELLMNKTKCIRAAKFLWTAKRIEEHREKMQRERLNRTRTKLPSKWLHPYSCFSVFFSVGSVGSVGPVGPVGPVVNAFRGL